LTLLGHTCRIEGAISRPIDQHESDTVEMPGGPGKLSEQFPKCAIELEIEKYLSAQDQYSGLIKRGFEFSLKAHIGFAH